MVVTDLLRSSRLQHLGFRIIYAGPFCLNTNCIMIPLEEIRDCRVSTCFFKIIFLITIHQFMRKIRWENAKGNSPLRCNCLFSKVLLHSDVLYLKNWEYYCIQVIGNWDLVIQLLPHLFVFCYIYNTEDFAGSKFNAMQETKICDEKTPLYVIILDTK